MIKRLLIFALLLSLYGTNADAITIVNNKLSYSITVSENCINTTNCEKKYRKDVPASTSPFNLNILSFVSKSAKNVDISIKIEGKLVDCLYANVGNGNTLEKINEAQFTLSLSQGGGWPQCCLKGGKC